MVALVKPDNRILDTIIQGDCLDVLRTLDTCSVDAIVTDPPAGISFMGKDWDANKGSRDIWISWLSQIMAECLRVLKPGGHALIWALPRTSHWTATAIEDAGFEIRDVLTHLFGSGFPKSHNISAAIDKHLGAEREVIGKAENGYTSGYSGKAQFEQGYRPKNYFENCNGTFDITAPSTPQAQQWQGYGTALKPANEHWILARKPLSEKSIAANVLKWNGCGALNIDQCRVGTNGGGWNGLGNTHDESQWRLNNPDGVQRNQGRFPSNLLLSHSLFCVPLGTRKVKANGGGQASNPDDTTTRNAYGVYTHRSPVIHQDPDGYETIQAWDCTEDCPIRLLDEQSGIRNSSLKKPYDNQQGWGKHGIYGAGGNKTVTTYTDQGGASRYFTQFCYTAKASRAERNRGCEGLPEKESRKFAGGEFIAHPEKPATTSFDRQQANNHPTVKPLALMSWLCRLITPPNGIVLDCFAGSGSTLVACVQEGFHFIGIEQSAEYAAIARARIAHALREVQG